MLMSVRDLLRILRRNLTVMAVCLVAGVTLGGFLALSQPASYTTHTRLFVSSNGSDSTDTLLQNSNLVLDRVPSYATLVNSPLVLSQVAQRLPAESVESMAGRITATNPLQTALIEITVRDTTARRAYDLAAAVSAVVMSVVPRLETAATGFVPIKITLVSQPELPARPDLEPAGSRLGLGILLGLLLGTVIAVGRELLDARLQDPEQLRTVLNLAPLGVLADSGRGDRAPLSPDDAYWTSRAGEGYRQLRANLRVLVTSGGLRSVLVSGPHAGDGAATVAQNLAIALSLIRVRVLLVEADLRHPRLAETFGIGATGNAGARDDGLSAVLAGDLTVDQAIHSWQDSTLHLLPAGSGAGASAELLASDVMRDLLGRLEQQFDLVIISAPPILEVADAAVLAAEVDGVVLALRCKTTRWTAVRQSAQALSDARARVLGAAVLGKTRGVGRIGADAVPGAMPATPEPAPAPVAGAGANDEQVTTSNRLKRPPRRPPVPPLSPGPDAIPRQLTSARGVAAVSRAVKIPANNHPANNHAPDNRTDDPNDGGRLA
jgi:capsular exopolysaccharide synthesis family protein